ncbi:MAG: DUF4231 domain-containing protein [Nitrospiraceae bacterium]|nr:MAG: DUF4231 domain-containing protein [Nitrospiraceae bacterium]
MTTQTSYREWLRQDLNVLIDVLNISDLQKHFLKSRWLGQVLWMEEKAAIAQVWYYILRLVAIVGGIIVPVLVSLTMSGQANELLLKGSTTVLSLLVAISVAVEEFLRFGERWRHYRRTVEMLKIEGWQFFQFSGPYRDYKTHADSYSEFAGRIENVTMQEVDVYITQVVKEKKEEEKK